MKLKSGGKLQAGGKQLRPHPDGIGRNATNITAALATLLLVVLLPG
jgi:hypothetical protein